MRKIVSVMVFGLLSGLASTAAMAQEMARESAPATMLEKSYQGLPYLNGGVGDEELAELQARQKDYNLKLVFAEKGGSYLADVNLLVLNTKGQAVFELASAGPILLTKLPAGTYRVKVTANGQVQQTTLGVSAKRRLERTFIW